MPLRFTKAICVTSLKLIGHLLCGWHSSGFLYLGFGTSAKAAALRQGSSVGAGRDDGASQLTELVWSLYIDINPAPPPAGSPDRIPYALHHIIANLRSCSFLGISELDVSLEIPANTREHARLLLKAGSALI